MAPDEEDVTEVYDEDLYDAAIEPTPKPEEAEVKEDRARDEKGRFSAKEEVSANVETAPVVETQPELPKEEKVDHRIPLTELLNEREKRQAEARRAQQLQQEVETLRQQLTPKQPQQIPDQFANPDQYNEYWQSQVNQLRLESEAQLRAFKAETSLEKAHEKHGEVFEKAYDTLMQMAEQGNRGPAQAVANSPNPGKALVDWYQREQVLAQVGTDPAAYRTKVTEELLSDPQFLAKAIEKAKGVASASPTQIKMPPSLNKAAPARGDTDNDTSDAAMYRNATGR
jgi:hypothetical protein